MSTVRPVNSVNIEHYIIAALKYAEYEENEDGTWTVTVPILPGVVTYGETKEEATEMLKDAVRNWVEVAEQCGDPIPDIEDRADL